MSFAPETEKLVNELIQAEYKNTVKNWGDKYNIVDNVSVSVLSKNDYETTLNMVTGMIFGLIMDIAVEGDKV